MASDEAISQFTEICGCSTRIAKQYLQLSDDNLEQATMLYFENGGADMNPSETSASASASAPAAAEPSSFSPLRPNDNLSSTTSTSRAQRGPTRPSRGGAAGYTDDSSGVVHIDSDDDDNDVEFVDASSHPAGAAPSHYESDEAMARRLQEEMYGAGGAAGPATDEVRAPMARTTETLVGPDLGDMGIGRGAGRGGLGLSSFGAIRAAPTGVFNQRQSSSIWNTEDDVNTTTPSSQSTPRARNANVRTSSPATAGTPATGSARLNRLAEMYKPPFDIMTDLPWEALREEARHIPRWIMINIQDPSIFDCQVLNRDLFKDPSIKETIGQSFLFAQYTTDDPRAQVYLNYYFQDYESQDAYPYIAIVDPRTGEQVKKWSGRPVPDKSEFLIQIHEFLDRYSLSVWAKNPVAVKKKGGDEKKKTVKDLDRMTEEEQLEMAMRESLGEKVRERSVDPDELTKDKGKQRATNYGDEDEEMQEGGEGEEEAEAADEGTIGTAVAGAEEQEAESPEHTLFLSIPTPSSPIPEPPLGPTVTRIQFRHASGRVIRRFSLQDPVRLIYEWLKSEPLSEEMKGKEFDCVCLGKNLIWSLDESVEKAGLRNGTVMVGWGGDEDDKE